MCDKQFLQHFAELKKRVLQSVLFIVLLFISLFYFSDHLFKYFALPLLQQFNNGQGLIAIDVTTPILTPIKFSLWLSLFIAIPFLLYQIWSFVTPGLYPHERQSIWKLILTSTVLFYLGMLFVYWLVLPMIFHFFTRWVPSYVLFMPDMQHYLSFSLKLFFAFGVAFQVPVIIYMLWRLELCSIEALQKSRAYVIVIAFILGMLLTPPDVISQIMLALPIYLLFELGVLFVRLSQPVK